MAGRGGPSIARSRVHPPDAAAARLAVELDVSPLLAQLLLNRGLRSAEAARAFLDVSVGNLSHPYDLPGMARAVDVLLDAIRRDREIVIYGDYDADGVTATSALVRVLRRLRARVRFYIPHRQREGYGLHAAVLAGLAAAGVGVVVAVDCGITATAAALAAREGGLDLVILDHHLPLGELPPALVIVNPRLSGVATDYCAAGLALQACRGLVMSAGSTDVEPDLFGVAALGTVADSVPLREDNRIIVAHGLRALETATWPGLRALLAIAKTEPPIAVRALSHGLAPRLNAAGRLDDASLGVRLLTSDDEGECGQIAATLDRLNRDRRAICDQVLAEAVEEVDQFDLAQEPALVLAREGWHPGVVGIVASQLVERYYRPTVLIAVKEGVGKGSARSIPPLHLVRAMSAASGTLTAYGGHAMAAGLTVPADAIDEFRARFVDSVRAALAPDDLTPIVDADAELALEAVTPELCAELDRLAPFGVGNPPPRFLTRGLRAVGTRLVGGGEHLRLVVTDGTIARDAIAFRQGEAVELLAFTQARVDLAYAVEIDRWSAQGWPQLVIEHLWTPDVDLSTVATDASGVLARLFARADDYLRPSGIDDAPAFHTKVVGVTFEGRQALLPLVRSGDRLVLARDPANPVDPHAIKVCLKDGRQLGFLRAELAARLAPTIDKGARYVATASALTGGGDRSWGLNVLVERESGSLVEGDGHTVGVPAPADLARTVRTRLLRGRPTTPWQDAVLGAVVAGRPSAIRIGPGRGLVAATAIAALGMLAHGGAPVTIAAPRASEVDAFAASVGPWLKELGITVWAAHGAMPVRSASRVADALGGGGVDVLIASTAWLVERRPPTGGLVHVVDDGTVDDVSAVRRALGSAALSKPALVLGPLAAATIADHAAAWGMEAVADLAAPRTNLRLVDHRGKGPWAPPDHAAGRLEVSVLIASGRRQAVEEARRLRDEQSRLSERVAYYHDGLPAALRRVIEDLLAAGALEAVVAGSLLVAPAMPAGVARVVATDLLPTRLLASEALGAVRAGGGLGLVELRYDGAVLAATEDVIERRYPSRETLVRCYRFFRSLQADGPWSWPLEPGRVAAAFAGAGDVAAGHVAAETLDAALEIFVETGVIARETVAASEGHAVRVQHSVTDPTERVDLERSLRYREGIRALAAWREVKDWAGGPAAAILATVAGA